jgi:hypothetical protein
LPVDGTYLSAVYLSHMRCTSAAARCVCCCRRLVFHCEAVRLPRPLPAHNLSSAVNVSPPSASRTCKTSHTCRPCFCLHCQGDVPARVYASVLIQVAVTDRLGS